MKPSLFALLATAALLAGCASPSTISFANASPHTTVGKGGSTASCTGERCGLLLRLKSTTLEYAIDKWPALEIGIVNRSSQPIEFTTASIVAYSGAKTVPVFLPDAYLKRLESEMRIASMNQFMRDSGAMMNAMKPQHATLTISNPAADARAVQMRNARLSEVRAISVNMADGRSAAGARPTAANRIGPMTAPTTIASGAAIVGEVRLEGPMISAGKPLRLVVTLANETHEFDFAVTR